MILKRKEFKDLSDKDKVYIKTIHANTDLSWDQRMSILINKFQISERTVRRWIKRLGYSEYREVENEEIREGKKRSYNPKSKYFIFTWAQNATPVHRPFWDNILRYAEFLDAEVGVFMGRYQNPTSLWTENMEKDEWWDEAFSVRDEDGLIVFSYLDGSRTHLHEYLDIMADVKIVPTAHSPLSGFEGLGGEKSAIFGHPRVHFQVLPALEGHNKKMMFTTGACTMKNYTDTKAGKKGEFHHTYGFVIVEIKDDLIFHIRQVIAERNGDFNDLIYRVTREGVFEVNECEAFVTGDIHVSQCHLPVMDKTMELFQYIRPKNLVVHDLFNGKSISHHDKRDPVKLYEKFTTKDDIVKEEIEGVHKFIDKYNLLDYNLIVVRSNHDEWLDRWIRNFDWRQDIPNAKEYAEYLYVALNGLAPKGIFPYILDKTYGDKITTLDFDESYKIKGWEVAQHGHMGANGSKSSMVGFRKLNTKMIVGDEHTPERKDGVVQVGTYSQLRMGFNKGPSSWMHCGAIIHDNGKVQMIFFAEDNNFTTLLG